MIEDLGSRSSITIFQNFSLVDFPNYITVKLALDRIKNGTSKDLCERIRAEKNKEKQDELKRNLPCVLFSGSFKRRAISGLIKHSGFVVLDFDKLEVADIKKNELKKNKYIAACWISPSGVGVKALVYITTDEHADHFRALEYDFPGIDRSGKDVSRICYESYDPEIYINEKFTHYDRIIIKEAVNNVVNVPETNEQLIYSNIKRWAEKRGELFSEGNRNNFIMRMASAMNRTGVPQESAKAFLMYDFVHAGSSFTLDELNSTVAKIYKNYASQFGIAAFEKEDIVEVSTGDVLNDRAFDGTIEVQDVIYFSDVYDSLKNMRTTGMLKGETTHFPGLDNHFRLMRGEVTVLHGYGNVGKSTFETQIQMNKAVKDGHKWAVFSPENYPTEHFYKDLSQMYIGKSINEKAKNAMSDLELEEAYDFVNDHFYYIYPKNDSPTPEYILKRFAEMAIKHKIDGVLIDPFNQLDNDWGKNGRDDRYLDKILSKFSHFAQDLNLFFHICAHPNKPQKTKSGDYDTPTMYDLAGGAMWGNKCHNILCYDRPNFFRDPQDPKCLLHSQKIKKQNVNGVPGTVEFEYDRSSFRFLERGFSPLIKQIVKINPNEFTEPKREAEDAPF